MSQKTVHFGGGLVIFLHTLSHFFQTLFDEGRSHQQNMEEINDLGGQLIKKVQIAKHEKNYFFGVIFCYVLLPSGTS